MGIAAISNAHFFTANAHYVAGSLNTWGWVVLCIGVIQWLVGLGVFLKNQFARWTGVLVLAANSIVQLMMMPAYPFWSLSIFALDILAIYGWSRTASESPHTDRQTSADRPDARRPGQRPRTNGARGG